MKTALKYLTVTTFVLATATVASIFYEGMILRWLSFVGVLIASTDIAFFAATAFGVFYYRNHKMLFYSHLFSVLIIIISIIITLIYGHNIPKILFTLWEFYILYFYGVMVVRRLWNK
jgi:hypothetical protein